MCDPVSLSAAVLVMSAASAAATVKSQQDAADAQSKQNEAQYKTTMQTYANNNSQVNLQEQQQRDQAIEKMNANNLEALQATGKSSALAGVTGVGGNSVAAALGAIAGTQDKYNNSVLANYSSGTAASEIQRQNVYASAASTINGLKTPVQPDYMSAGLKIANAAVGYGNASLSTPGMSTTDIMKGSAGTGGFTPPAGNSFTVR